MSAYAPIVLVEDDPHDAFFVYQALESARIRNHVVACRDAAEARRVLTREGGSPTPALLILDVHLGGESGIEFLRWVRSQPDPLGKTPVMMLTSSQRQEHVTEATALGAMWFLSKPVTETQLLEALRELGFAVTTNLASGEIGFRILERK